LSVKKSWDLLVSSLPSDGVARFNGTTGGFVSGFVPSGGGGLNGPFGVAIGPDGNVYVSSSITGDIRRYNGLTGAFMGIFAVVGLNVPCDLTFGTDQNGDGVQELYVADQANGNVVLFNGATGAAMGLFATGQAASGFNGLTFGPDGNADGVEDLYVSDGPTFRILRFNGLTGAPLPAPGNPGAVFVPVGAGGLDTPTGLTFCPLSCEGRGQRESNVHSNARRENPP